MNAVPNESRMPPTRNRYRDIFDVWWPLALSWFFMALELPAVSATMTRLTEPARHLAAFGGVTMPICFIIESPIIMLLSASTTLCLDKRSYHHMRLLMMYAGGVLTVIHALLALTPLYYLVVGDLLRVPVEILEPTRIGLVLMIPWTWAIAYRRFNQGIIIRFGNPRVVGFALLLGEHERGRPTGPERATRWRSVLPRGLEIAARQGRWRELVRHRARRDVVERPALERVFRRSGLGEHDRGIAHERGCALVGSATCVCASRPRSPPWRSAPS